jgi:hypothetical protein
MAIFCISFYGYLDGTDAANARSRLCKKIGASDFMKLSDF